MVSRTLIILHPLVQNFKSVPDHFEILYINPNQPGFF